MATVQKHYEEVLSDIYSWMYGGFDAAIQRNTEFINKHNITPTSSGVAVDLGAGCGFQSIPLARAGFSVKSFDLDIKLLKELKNSAGDLDIETVQDDLTEYDKTLKTDVELFVCMVDTILHLESKEKVASLLKKVLKSLETDGRFIITFRDLTHELINLDRFIPVRSSDNIIFTCFLEYEQEHVKVHDIVYKLESGKWNLYKSFYYKLRLSAEWFTAQLLECGFRKVDSSVENGFVTLIAKK